MATEAIFIPRAGFPALRSADLRTYASTAGTLPSAFFHSEPDGRGATPSVFRWRVLPSGEGKPMRVQVIAIGDEGRALLMGHLNELMRLFGATDFVIRPVPFSLELGDCLRPLIFQRLSIQTDKLSQPFSGKRIGVVRSLDELIERCGGVDVLNARVEDVVKRGITALAEAVGIELPNTEEWVMGDVAVRSVGHIPLGGATPTFFHCCVSGALRANLVLGGVWNIGRGASKGAGRIFTKL